jgi:hypothetical protein
VILLNLLHNFYRMNIQGIYHSPSRRLERIETVPCTKDALIQKVVLSILTELAVSLVLVAVVCCFTASTGGIGLVITSLVIQCAAATIFRSLGAIAAYHAAKYPDKPCHKFLKAIAEATEWGSAANFLLGSGTNAQTLIHESGHFLAASSLYQNANASIHILPFQGGYTHFSRSSLSAFGNRLGSQRSSIFVTAAGASAALSVSAGVLTAGLLLRKKNPVLAKYLIVWGTFDFIKHILYALSAFYTSSIEKGHDFVQLSLLGLHPTVAIARMIAIPILIHLGFTVFSLVSHFQKHKFAVV